MASDSIITNDRQAREVTAVIEQITNALSSEQTLKSLVEGLPVEVIGGVRRSLAAELRELEGVIRSYQEAKSGSFEGLKTRAGNDPGAQLIVARVTRGWSQKELARRLFIPEQQVQRYEAERYRSISLGNLIRVARALGVRLSANISTGLQESWIPSYEMSSGDAQSVLKHARANGWLEKADQSDESGISSLKRTVAEHVGEYGTPSLLRTGLNVKDHSNDSDDWLLLSWKAQVTRKAVAMMQRERVKYRPLDLTWLMDLVRLSALDDGPSRVRQLLAKHGIVLIVEPHIVGMKVDGAAFLVDETPVIGLTLLRDSIDNFWFTLLHEVAHVILHYRTGLASGFFDEIDNQSIDELEAEADSFASNLLIPDELWVRSPARIARDPIPIERIARQLEIAPAIVFGRIRMERKNYTLFSDKIGRGQIRNRLFDKNSEVTDDEVN